jgi:hypothetical protein
MSKKENILNPDTTQIEAWKKQYGEVYLIEVAEEADKFEANTMAPDLDQLPRITGYLKKPDRKIMNFALVTMPRNIIAAGKAVLKDCWLGGDERLLTDEAYSATAGMQAIEIVEIYQSRLKKL